MPILVVERGDDKGIELPIEDGNVYYFGRDPKVCAIVLSDTLSSRRHFQIEAKSGSFTLTDLNSTNGSFVNGQQVDGPTEDVMRIEPLASRLEAFGARPFSVDGHDLEALDAPSRLALDGRPSVVLAYTNPCQGVPLLEERRPFLHYLRFKSEEEKQRYAEYLTEITEGVA